MKNPHGQTKRPQLLLVWSLLFGVALIAVCSGMQGTLLGLRASLENFGVDTIGIIMSAYYAGFLLGARIVPKWVGRVGHIRVFAALATIASAFILVHSTFVDPLIWFLLRALTGFCLSGLFMVSESWLNTITDNDNRGRLLAAYMFTVTLGFIGGQFLLNLASPMGFELFVLASVVLSFAIVPMLLSNISAPAMAYAEHLQLYRLIRLSPLGAMGVFVQGLSFSSVMWLTAVFGAQSGFSDTESAYLVGILTFGGLVLLLPVGRLSDLQERRHTLLLLSAMAAGAALFVPLAARLDSLWFLSCLLFLVGGAAMCFYSVSMSHINDHVRGEQILSASGSIIFINGIGGLSGPILSTQVMKILGPGGLYYFVALVYLFMAVFTLYRMSVRAPITAEEQSHGMAVMMQTSQVIVAEAMDETDQGDPLAPEAMG